MLDHRNSSLMARRMVTAMNDNELQNAVIAELEFEPSIDSRDIRVFAHDGAVTLAGHTSTYYQRWAAEGAAWRVKGVKAVAMNIDVRNAGGISDEEIAKRARNLLKWDSTVPTDIRVTVDRGWITLEGTVHWQYQRANAENDLRHLHGLTGISNNLAIVPAVQMAVVQEHIEEALKRSAEVEARLIRVEVRGGDTVTLSGKVDTWSEREAVERAVWATAGVRAVVDHLSIG